METHGVSRVKFRKSRHKREYLQKRKILLDQLTSEAPSAGGSRNQDERNGGQHDQRRQHNADDATDADAARLVHLGVQRAQHHGVILHAKVVRSPQRVLFREVLQREAGDS